MAVVLQRNHLGGDKSVTMMPLYIKAVSELLLAELVTHLLRDPVFLLSCLLSLPAWPPAAMRVVCQFQVPLVQARCKIVHLCLLEIGGGQGDVRSDASGGPSEPHPCPSDVRWSRGGAYAEGCGVGVGRHPQFLEATGLGVFVTAHPISVTSFLPQIIQVSCKGT